MTGGAARNVAPGSAADLHHHHHHTRDVHLQVSGQTKQAKTSLAQFAPSQQLLQQAPLEEAAAAANGGSDAGGILLQGLYAFLYEVVVKPSAVWRPIALLLQVWECVQLAALALSATPSFPWTSSGDMSVLAKVFQYISFGYYVSSNPSVGTAQFAVMFALASVTVVLSAGLAVAVHPALEDAKISVGPAVSVMRWLLLGLCHWWYLPMLTQLLSTFRCSTDLPFLGTPVCWTAGHIVLAVFCGILIPAVTFLAAVGIVTVHEHSSSSKHPLAMPHGRVVLLVQLIKLVLVVMFALDQIIDKWVLIIALLIGLLACTFLHVAYLPFFWQPLNQVAAAGYAGSIICALVLILITARNSASIYPGWVLLYTAPWAMLCGYMFAALRWHHRLAVRTDDITNVYQLELVVRRLLATADRSEAVMDQADALYAQGLQFFPDVSILHQFVAQYLAEIRHNTHLERGQIQALRLRHGPLDEQFYAYMRARRAQDDSVLEDRQNVSNRIRFEKVKAQVTELVLHARRQQVNFWMEMLQATPDLHKLLKLATGIRAAMRHCEKLFSQMLALNPSSVAVLQLYAQYMREVVNHAQRADDLLEQATELEAMQARARAAERDVVFMALGESLDANQDNVGIVTVSSLPHDLGTVTDANAVFLQMCGYTKRELLGKNVSAIVPQPISSVHQKYLELYQETGRGIMINVTRTVFIVHKAGYIVPAVETFREFDTSMSVVAQSMVTADSFIWVSMPTMTVTAVCHKSLTMIGCGIKAVNAGAITAQMLLPDFVQLWQTHEANMAAYESAALEHVDNRADMYSAMPPQPMDMVYGCSIQLGLSAVGQPTDATRIVQAHLRLQLVKVTNATILVLKWRPAEDESHAATASSLSRHEEISDDEEEKDLASLEGLSVDSNGYGHPSGDDEETEEQHGETSPLVGDSSDSAGSDTMERRVRFGSLVARPAAADIPDQGQGTVAARLSPRPQQSANQQSAQQSPQPRVSGQSSHGSASSSAMFTTLHRTLSRHENDVSPGVAWLRRVLTVLMFVGGAILIANAVYATQSAAEAENLRDLLQQASSKVLAMHAAAIRTQDLLLHNAGFITYMDAAREQQLRLELSDDLDTFEVIHQSLYAAAQSNPATNALYVTESVTLRSRDMFGKIRSVRANPLGAGIQMVSEGRLALQQATGAFNSTNPHSWFVYNNVEAVLTDLHRMLDHYMKSGIGSLQDSERVSAYLLIAIIVIFVVLSSALIVPSMFRLHKQRKEALHPFLEVPMPVLRALCRQTEASLEASVQALHDEDDASFQQEDEEAKEASETLEIALRAAGRMPAATQRHFRVDRLMITLWMARMLVGSIVLVAALSGLYAWGTSITESAVSFFVEDRLSIDLAVDPYTTFFDARQAMSETNVTAAVLQMTTDVPNDLAALMTHERGVMHGASNLFGIGAVARSSLRLDTVRSLFVADGCATQSPTCATFYDGVFGSGLHAVIEQFVQLMQAAVSQIASSVSRQGFNLRTAATALADKDMQACDTMVHKYLANAMAVAQAMISTASTDELHVFTTWLSVITALCLVAMLFSYIFYYRSVFRSLDSQLHDARCMLLLLPEETLRMSPSAKQLVKQLQQTALP